jgi:hypothetical protein
VSKVAAILSAMRRNPSDVRYADLCKVCDHYFGDPRQKGTSHRIYKTPWPGDPRVNIQSNRGKAKPYQVRQVLAAVERLESTDEKD